MMIHPAPSIEAIAFLSGDRAESAPDVKIWNELPEWDGDPVCNADLNKLIPIMERLSR